MLAILILVGAAGAFGFRQWCVKTAALREHDAMVRAQACLKGDQPAEALALAEAFLRVSKDSAWSGIQLQALRQGERIT